MEKRSKISTGPNAQPINVTIAGTGPGIPDDALAPGEELPHPPNEEEVERMERVLRVQGDEDDLPLEGE